MSRSELTFFLILWLGSVTCMVRFGGVMFWSQAYVGAFVFVGSLCSGL